MSTARDQRETLNLNGTWRLSSRPLDSVGTAPGGDMTLVGEVEVPGHVQLQIGLEDPFRDTADVVVVNRFEWVYEKSVQNPAGPGRRFLCFEGTDYYCDVWVNGQHVGHHAGMYSDWEIDITEALGADVHFTVQVAVSCPWRIVENAQPLLPATFESGLNPETEYLKGVHVFQWDGWPMRGQTLLPFGLWRDVSLDVRPEPTLRGIAVETLGIESGRATMALHLECWSGESSAVRFDTEFSIEPVTFDGATTTIPVSLLIEPGYSDTTVEFSIDDPRLWWTWDLGQPDLYRARIADAETQFGVRQFRRDAETLAVVARHGGMNHLHRAAGQAEGHRPHGAAARPADQLVQLRDHEPLVGNLVGHTAQQRILLGAGLQNPLGGLDETVARKSHSHSRAPFFHS